MEATKIFSIPIAADVYNDFVTGIAKAYGYQDKVQNADGEWIDNPVDKEDFSKAKVKESLKGYYVNWMSQKAAQEASDSTRKAMENIKI